MIIDKIITPITLKNMHKVELKNQPIILAQNCKTVHK